MNTADLDVPYKIKQSTYTARTWILRSKLIKDELRGKPSERYYRVRVNQSLGEWRNKCWNLFLDGQWGCVPRFYGNFRGFWLMWVWWGYYRGPLEEGAADMKLQRGEGAPQPGQGLPGERWMQEQFSHPQHKTIEDTVWFQSIESDTLLRLLLPSTLFFDYGVPGHLFSRKWVLIEIMVK